MTHRDRAGDPPGRREAAGDAGHRQGFPTPSGGSPAAGSPARPERRFPKAFGLRMALRRGAWLPMSRIATPRACSPKALGNRLYGSLSTLLGIRQSLLLDTRWRVVRPKLRAQVSMKQVRHSLSLRPWGQGLYAIKYAAVSGTN